MRYLQTSALCFALVAVSACANLPIEYPGSGSTTTNGGTVTGGTSAVAADIVRYTNDARRQNGLPPLAANSRLMEAARIQAEQMASYQRADHTISGATYPTMQ